MVLRLFELERRVGCFSSVEWCSVSYKGAIILVAAKAAVRRSFLIALSLEFIRLVGPDTLSAATTRPAWSKIGAARQVTPLRFSSRSMATPCSRTKAKCSRRWAFCVIVLGVFLTNGYPSRSVVTSDSGKKAGWLCLMQYSAPDPFFPGKAATRRAFGL